MKDKAQEADLFRKLKILVVDDSPEMRRLLIALLSTMGITNVEEARDGTKGLALFSSFKPDIIITDAAMRPMDGYEMTRLIRAADKGTVANPDIPILMISGHTGRENVDHARDQGVSDYLPKPLSATMLYEAILDAISRPIHFVEKPGYRGPSPMRRLHPRQATTTPKEMPSGNLIKKTFQ